MCIYIYIHIYIYMHVCRRDGSNLTRVPSAVRGGLECGGGGSPHNPVGSGEVL